jgi:hypothetical protein
LAISDHGTVVVDFEDVQGVLEVSGVEERVSGGDYQAEPEGRTTGDSVLQLSEGAFLKVSASRSPVQP